MNKETLNKLKELAQKATPGPWYADNPIPGKPRFTVADCFSSKVYMQDQRPSHGTTGLDDALFIAAANPAAVLELIAMAERTTSPVSQQQAAVDIALEERVRDAIAAALGEAMDCTRVWSAWSYGTMGPDDFSVVANDDDRLDEIVQAALAAMREQQT